MQEVICKILFYDVLLVARKYYEFVEPIGGVF